MIKKETDMRSALFWDITHSIVGNSLPTFRDNLSLFHLQGEPDWLYRNVGKELPAIRCVITQKRVELIYFAAEG